MATLPSGGVQGEHVNRGNHHGNGAGGPLPFTGLNTISQLVVAAILLGGGALLTVLGGQQFVYHSTPLELAAAASATVVFHDGHGTVTLDDVAEFSGKIKPAAAGDHPSWRSRCRECDARPARHWARACHVRGRRSRRSAGYRAERRTQTSRCRAGPPCHGPPRGPGSKSPAPSQFSRRCPCLPPGPGRPCRRHSRPPTSRRESPAACPDRYRNATAAPARPSASSRRPHRLP